MYEHKVYSSIKPAVGFPKVYWCGTAGRCNVMVMDLLGSSLESLYVKCGRKFSMKTILMLAIQLLDRVEHQHANHFLHRDIKPDNFLMGRAEHKHTVFIIDMGLSKRFENPETLEHIAYRDNKKFTGTPRYASTSTHKGIEQARRDDLESLGYMLMYFNLGKLPWQGLKARTKQEKYDKIGAKKLEVPISDLCKGFPKEFELYLTYCRQLRFSEKPNYTYLRNLFKSLFKSFGYKDDWVFDWMAEADPADARPVMKIGPQVTNPKSGHMMEAYGQLEKDVKVWRRKSEAKEKEILKLKEELRALNEFATANCSEPYRLKDASLLE